MQRVAARDKSAQREVAERLGPRVLRLCRALIRDRSDAEDAAQQALETILLSARGFQAEGRLEGWADTITARTAFRTLRRARSGRSLIAHWAQPDEVPDLRSDFRGRSATSLVLERYLARLSSERREAFVLKYAAGYSVEEIAALTESAPGTVKDRLIAAKRLLRQMIHRDRDRDGGRSR